MSWDWGDLKPDPVFLVGQRVRPLGVTGGPAKRKAYAGREGVVTGSDVMRGMWIGRMGYWVQWSNGEVELMPCLLLEAVVPDGSAPGNWDDSVWKPPSRRLK